jgi:hypothetical protein
MVIFKAARARHGKLIDESAANGSCNLSHCLIAETIRERPLPRGHIVIGAY